MDLIRQEEREGLILLVNILSPRWRDLVIKEKETRGEHPASSHQIQLPHSTIFYFFYQKRTSSLQSEILTDITNCKYHWYISLKEEKLYSNSTRSTSHWDIRGASNYRDFPTKEKLYLKMNLLESIDLKWKCIEEKNEQACWRTITGIISKYISNINHLLIILSQPKYWRFREFYVQKSKFFSIKKFSVFWRSFWW